MLETLRKHHYILMLFVAVLVCVAFVFFGPAAKTGNTNDRPFVTVDGVDYSDTDAKRINSQVSIIGRMMDQSSRMSQYTDPLAKYHSVMSQVAAVYHRKSAQELDVDFVTNVALLRAQAKRLGVAVSREDLVKFVQTLPGLQTNGQFDSQRYEAVLNDQSMGSRDNNEREIFVMLRDVMTYQKIETLTSAIMPPSPAEVESQYAQEHTIITAGSVVVARDKQTAVPPTDEEIQKYYDAEKIKFEKTLTPEAIDGVTVPAAPDPSLLSEEKRGLVYLHITVPPAPAALPAAPQPEDTTNLPDDQKKTKEEEYKKKVEDHTAAIAKRAEELTAHDKAVKELKAQAAKVSNELVAEDRGTRTFAEVVKDGGLEAKTAEPFVRSAPPGDFQSDPKGLNAVFMTPGDARESQIAESTNGYLLFELTKVEAPALLPLDQVKEKITGKLQEEALTAALKTAAETARTKMADSMKAGKSLEEAATEAGLIATVLPAFSSLKPLAPETPNQAIVSMQAAGLNPGEISEPQSVDGGLLLVGVIKKELPNDPKMAEDKKALTEKLTQPASGLFSMPSPLFSTWFNHLRSAQSELKVD